MSSVLTELRKQLPFGLLGLDTDNDTVFMNETLKAYCDAATADFKIRSGITIPIKAACGSVALCTLASEKPALG